MEKNPDSNWATAGSPTKRPMPQRRDCHIRHAAPRRLLPPLPAARDPGALDSLPLRHCPHGQAPRRRRMIVNARQSVINPTDRAIPSFFERHELIATPVFAVEE